jgi:hypothetical protein
MPASRTSDWERIKREAAADVPITQDPESPYDPNDAAAVDAFWDRAFIRRQDRGGSQRASVAR